jgi:hypothetical protein
VVIAPAAVGCVKLGTNQSPQGYATVFEKLNLERWYRVFVYVGVLLFFPGIPLVVEGHPVFAANLMVWGAAFFFLGMGEWINHPASRENRGSASFFGPGMARVPHPGGLLLDAVGALLFVLAMALTLHSIWLVLPNLL